VAKFHEATPFGFKVLAVNTLHFKPIFDSLLKKVVRGPLSSMGGALVRVDYFLAPIKIWGRSTL